MEFNPIASAENGKIIVLDTTTPYAFISFQCANESKILKGSITHKEDFKVLWAIYKERKIDSNEEVLFFWSNKYKNKLNKKNYKKIFSFRMISRFSIVLCFVLGFCFVAGINDLSIKGFVLQELKNDFENMSDENRMLELGIMQLESYENISVRANELKMVEVDKVNYVSFTPGTVARK